MHKMVVEINVLVVKRVPSSHEIINEKHVWAHICIQICLIIHAISVMQLNMILENFVREN